MSDRNVMKRLFPFTTVGHDNVVNLLLEAGVNVNLRNNKGQTALMLAASCGNESVGYFLLQVCYLSLQLRVHALADLGCARDAPPLSGPISFIFMHFPAKILPNDRLSAQTQGLAPPVWEILDPPLSC